VRGRVNRGRELLRGRLTRRGLAVPAALLTVVLETHNLSLAMSAAFVNHTVKAALATVTGQTTAVGLISGEVASLVTTGMHTMWLGKVKIATAIALTVGMIGFAAWTVASAGLAVKSPDVAAVREPGVPNTARKDDQGGQTVKDLYGDPLPA